MSGRFHTGQLDQTNTAEWARQRLSTTSRKGRVLYAGDTPISQHGVIFADGVGLGKTWEALAACALLLEHQGKRKQAGGRRKTVRWEMARILILCPPGLVTKWSSEIRNVQGFSKYLSQWAEGVPARTFVKETLTELVELRKKNDLSDLSKQYKKAHELDQGTYVCNWNLLLNGEGSGKTIAGIVETKWDAIILDEAHHLRGRKAVAMVIQKCHVAPPTLFLSATPFQLNPGEIHSMFALILDSKSNKDYALLDREPLKSYVARLNGFFKGGQKPEQSLKSRAEQTLSQLIARNEPKGDGRYYYVLDSTGSAHIIPDPKKLEERYLYDYVYKNAIKAETAFEAWYLRSRLQLADKLLEGEKGFVAVHLRQLLSTPSQAKQGMYEFPPYSARLEALGLWAERQFEEDLRKTIKDGIPRKTVVFTSFVKEATTELHARLFDAFQCAYRKIIKTDSWRNLAAQADKEIEKTAMELLSRILKSDNLRVVRPLITIINSIKQLKENPNNNWLVPLFGRRTFCELFREDFRRRIDALDVIQNEINSRKKGDPYIAFHRRERANHIRGLKAIINSRLISTYVGTDDQKDRDNNGEAFRSPLSPWVLVASNVGSEGIDLHTYAAHLVHFDIEWNPARMEQREGRADRLNRKLKGAVNIYFCLVRDSYDERMFHQLIARQRWHSVLLGGHAKEGRWDDEAAYYEEVAMLGSKDHSRLVLDLKPKSRTNSK